MTGTPSCFDSSISYGHAAAVVSGMDDPLPRGRHGTWTGRQRFALPAASMPGGRLFHRTEPAAAELIRATLMAGRA